MLACHAGSHTSSKGAQLAARRPTCALNIVTSARPRACNADLTSQSSSHVSAQGYPEIARAVPLRKGRSFNLTSAGHAALELEFAHVDGDAGAGRLGGVHRAECFGSLAQILGCLEQLQHNRRSLRFVK